MLVLGGNSALKEFVLVCQLVQLQKQISYFDKLWQNLKKLSVALHTVAKKSVTIKKT